MSNIQASKERLDSALSRLEQLISVVNAAEHQVVHKINMELQEENRLAKERIVLKDRDINELKNKNQEALKEVQAIINKIEKIRKQ